MARGGVQPGPDGLYPPVGSPGFREPEENDAWVREMWAKWNRPGAPGPCDCGYFTTPGLVMCFGKEREHCRQTAQERLRRHYADRQQREVRSRRAWPGSPYAKAGYGTCNWCGAAIVHGRHKSRMWHDGRADEPDCKTEILLRIDRDVQKRFLLNRDGFGCAGCQETVGGWTHHLNTLKDVERWRTWGPSWKKRFPEDVWVGDYTAVGWATHMQVDHIVALGLVAHLDDAQRRLFFSPANLQLLCDACHKAKTVDDTRAIRILQAHIADGGDPEALRELWTWVLEAA